MIHCTFYFTTAYGLTELSPVSNYDRVPVNVGSVGQLVPNTQAKVCEFLINIKWIWVPVNVGYVGQLVPNTQAKVCELLSNTKWLSIDLTMIEYQLMLGNWFYWYQTQKFMFLARLQFGDKF